MCVCVCVHCRSFFDAFWCHFGVMLYDFRWIWAPFWDFLVSGGCPGIPGSAFGSPWAPGCPQQGLRERKTGSLDPLWPPKMTSFWSYFCIYFRWKTHQNKYWFFNDFWVDFEWIVGPRLMFFCMFFRWLFLSHFRCDFVRILGAFCGSSTLILAIPSMRKRVFWNSAEFEIW